MSKARRLGAAVVAAVSLLSAPARAEDETDWMFWLEDMDFCPLMDCDPRPPNIRLETFRLAGVTIAGTLSAGVIRRQIRQQSNRFRTCYERQLQRHPGLTGRVAVRFVIGHSGSVTNAIIESSTLGDNQVETCVREVMTSITFPTGERDGLYIVTYPFWFQQRAEPNR